MIYFQRMVRPAWNIDGARCDPARAHALHLAVAWNDLRGPNDLPVQLDRLADDRWQIAPWLL